jgi:hypothetical protein
MLLEFFLSRGNNFPTFVKDNCTAAGGALIQGKNKFFHEGDLGWQIA